MTIQSAVNQGYRFFTRPLCWVLTGMYFLPISAAAQPGEYGCWNSYAINGKINERWSTVGDYQLRFYDFRGDLQQILLRSFLQYTLNKDWEAGTGYTYSFSLRYDEGDKQQVIENRITQQVIYHTSFSRLTLINRARLEERYISCDWSYRFRYFVNARYFLTAKKSWYVSVFDEYFFQLDGFAFDQNRFFAGIGIRLNDHFRLESGNLTQTFPSGRRNQLFTQLVHSFRWKKQ